MQLLVALKWSALRTEVDPRSGAARVLPGQFGLDPAGLAALEWALHLAEPIEATVTVVTVGPGERRGQGCEKRSPRCRSSSCASTAPRTAHRWTWPRCMAPLAAEADLVVVGARSIDGRSAAVAPALAALLDRPQACGLVGVDWADDAPRRRAPSSRRPTRAHLRWPCPAVISMESGTDPVETGRAAGRACGRRKPKSVSSLPITRSRGRRPERSRPIARVLASCRLPPLGEEPRERIASTPRRGRWRIPRPAGAAAARRSGRGDHRHAAPLGLPRRGLTAARSA